MKIFPNASVYESARKAIINSFVVPAGKKGIRLSDEKKSIGAIAKKAKPLDNEVKNQLRTEADRMANSHYIHEHGDEYYVFLRDHGRKYLWKKANGIDKLLSCFFEG